MPTQPFERPLLGLQANLGEPNPSVRSRTSRNSAAARTQRGAQKEGPGLSADVIGHFELAASVAPSDAAASP